MGLKARYRRVNRFLAGSADSHLRTRVKQPLRDRSSDSAGAAGHYGGFVTEKQIRILIFHFTILPQSALATLLFPKLLFTSFFSPQQLPDARFFRAFRFMNVHSTPELKRGLRKSSP